MGHSLKEPIFVSWLHRKCRQLSWASVPQRHKDAKTTTAKSMQRVGREVTLLWPEQDLWILNAKNGRAKKGESY